MPRRVLAVTVILAAISLAHVAPASAKGSTFRFGEDTYAVGDRVTGHARVEIWAGSGLPEQGPYTVYLVKGRQLLWFGHLPSDAVVATHVDTHGLEPFTKRVRAFVWLNVAFRMPDVAAGEYAVWVCRKECGANSGFGDLVSGFLRVASEDEASNTADPQSAWLSVFASVARALQGAVVATSTLLPSPAPTTCIIEGTNGDDDLQGTWRDDIICAHGGNDYVAGRGGDDVLRLGSGPDTFDGGPGDDVIIAGRGRDQGTGGIGDDRVYLNRGDDLVSGDWNPGGADLVSGGPGNDACLSVSDARGEDHVDGGSGRDTFNADATDVVVQAEVGPESCEDG